MTTALLDRLTPHCDIVETGNESWRLASARWTWVAALADGFAWNGKTYPSLSKIALAITGSRWNSSSLARFVCR